MSKKKGSFEKDFENFKTEMKEMGLQGKKDLEEDIVSIGKAFADAIDGLTNLAGKTENKKKNETKNEDK